jgi:NAD(P)-dependent dehydrogenase (short-subunit alcohol dehydrogenase family)
VTGTQVPARPGGLLEGKIAIVTGASRGIGAAAARLFADAGAAVVLAARDQQAIASLAEQIAGEGGDALAVRTDVSDPAAVEQLVRDTVRAYGRLDAAFNNAGDGHQPAPLAEVSVDDFDRVVATSLRGIFLSMKYEIPALLEGGGGAIVNMSSTAGLRGVKGIASYSAAKHGILGLTKSAALDYGEQNIRVNAVAPGPILTHRLAELSEEKRREIGAYLPLGRVGQVDEVAATVAWLLSDQASFITGATIPIDGGKLASGA